MKLQIMSDLHREFYKRGWKPNFDQDADYIIMAGDISNKPEMSAKFLNEVADGIRGTIICIPGNHEYYGQQYPSVLGSYRKAINETEHNERIKFLNQEHIMFEDSDIAFLCATLWTDFDKEREMYVPMKMMNDYRVVKKGNSYITTRDILVEHKQTLNVFSEAMEGPLAGKRVVMVTHHGPSYRSVPDMFQGDPLNGAYVSSLEWFIEKYEPIVWVHGHTHNFFDYNLGPTRVICNPVGYPGENGHKKLFTIEV